MPGFLTAVVLCIKCSCQDNWLGHPAGYFDVRDLEDNWIRVACTKGTMIVLPEGIYHRFTLDEGNYIKVRAGVGQGLAHNNVNANQLC